jgi:glycosyltransferase involved in cell wall biosynthesis
MRFSKNMNKSTLSKNIVIVSHKVVHLCDDDLVLYLNNKKYQNVLHIYHSFSSAKNRKSYCFWYKNGIQYKKFESFEYKNLPEVFIYIKEWFYTFKWILQTNQRWDTYIGLDGLCVYFGNLLKKLGAVRKTIFWAIDFVPNNRFSNSFKNRIYHYINTHGYKNSDEMWDLSQRMAPARKKFFKIDSHIYKKHRIVPYGMWTKRIKRYSYKESQENSLIFIGNIAEYQGVQLIIPLIPELAKKLPGFTFKVIGEGEYGQQVREMARALHIEKYCQFMGQINDPLRIERELAQSTVAVAPYIKKMDYIVYYADPAKIKTYLACGVPIVLTDIPWNARDIEEKKCGIVVDETPDDLIGAILHLMKPNINEKYRENTKHYSKKFDYENIFNSLNL